MHETMARGSSDKSMENDAAASRAFIAHARQFLTGQYLPKIERCLERLSDEQIWWRSSPGANSIGNLVLHLCGNASQWIICGLGGKPDYRQRQTEFEERGPVPRRQLLSLLRKSVAEVDAVLADFDSTSLLHQYEIQQTQGTALSAIFHVTEHFSMHTGQIILLTKLLANVDLAFYDFASGKPVHTWHEPQGVLTKRNDSN